MQALRANEQQFRSLIRNIPGISFRSSMGYDAPPVFVSHDPLQITVTLLLPAALAALVYALMTVATPHDDLGAWAGGGPAGRGSSGVLTAYSGRNGTRPPDITRATIPPRRHMPG